MREGGKMACSHEPSNILFETQVVSKTLPKPCGILNFEASKRLCKKSLIDR